MYFHGEKKKNKTERIHLLMVSGVAPWLKPPRRSKAEDKSYFNLTSDQHHSEEVYRKTLRQQQWCANQCWASPAIFNSTTVVYIITTVNMSIATRLQMFSNYYVYMEGISCLDFLIFEISMEFSMHKSIPKHLL